MATQPSPQEVRETIRQEWIAAAPFWKKWYAKLASQSRAATNLVMEGACLEPGQHVLDIASGSGEPALSLAGSLRTGGRVVATDLVPEMLETAREHAAIRNLQNMEFYAASAEDLPFDDEEFDCVTSRFGIMFIPDIQKALGEMRRVLKPGGRVSFVTWGPMEENPVFAVTMGPFLKYVAVPAPPPDAPHVFRFKDEAKLAQVLTAAGFQDVRAAKHKVEWPWPGSPEEAWESVNELAAPFKRMMAAVPADKKESAIEEVLAGIRRFYNGKVVDFPATLVAVSARK